MDYLLLNIKKACGQFKRINLKYLLLFVKLEAGWMGILLLFFKGKNPNINVKM